jgi:outer membrane protein insertion porin family
MYRQPFIGSMKRSAAGTAPGCRDHCAFARTCRCQHPLENERMSLKVAERIHLKQWHHLAGGFVLFFLLLGSGCQLTETRRAQFADSRDQQLPPASQPPVLSPQAVTQPPGLSPQAVIRGQSGEGWVASDPSGNGNPASVFPNQAPSTNRYQLPPPTTVPNNAPYAPYTAPSQFSSDYANAVAPGTLGGQTSIAPGTMAMPGDPLAGLDIPNISAPGGYQPRMQIAPLDVYLQEARTGRIILGGSVNSDLGVAGQLIIDERNFDIRAFPRSWSDVFSGYAFRGAGQSFRAELMPGNLVERYTVNWATPNMFGYLPYSLSVGGYLFSRLYRDWTEQRLGGRIGLGYAITKDLSIGTEIRGENVKIMNPRVNGVDALDDVLGDNELYTARFRINRDTRDSVFLATEGTLLELIYDQSFGSYDFPQGQINFSHYSRVRERPDGMGRHVLVNTWRVGFSGTETPIYENFFAGGFSTLRGFRFRGASPVEGGVQVGGRFMFLGSLEYMFPLTADEMLRGVAFVDYGTIERDITFNRDTFRVAPGLGVRIAVPALGPAPLAFDFAVPVSKADGDEKQLLSFYMGFTR